MPDGFATLTHGVDIAYETFGDPQGRPLLLVMGLGGPSIWWDDDLCGRLADRGFYAIRFDNRDVGRSTKVQSHRITKRQIVQAYTNRRSTAPYSLSDMADDGLGLLDHLGIEAAHVWGVSMGGMIAQTMAIAKPDRVLSLTSTMSTTGRRTVGWTDPRLFPLMLAPRQRSVEDYIKHSRRVWHTIGSPEYPEDAATTAERARDTWERGISTSGVIRQMMAILIQPDRTPALRELQLPALVIHGLADRLVHPSGGRATAAAIPGAELMLIRGMGHDLPPALYPLLVDAVDRTAQRTQASSGTTTHASAPHS